MNELRKTYDVFLSYNTRDRAAVEKVGRWLLRRGLKCFMDRWYLVPGIPWPQALEQALAKSEAVAVFLGPGDMGRWQQREQYLALDRQAMNQIPVVPVLLPGSDPALGFLSLNTWVDLRADLDDERQLNVLAGAIRGVASAELTQESAPVLRTVCPFRGLLPYREEDAPFLFGRRAYIEQLVEAIRRHSFVTVFGASGSGKSSVVRAGLVPYLRREACGSVWEIVKLYPGDRPFRSLADALLPLLEPSMSERARLVEVGRLASDFVTHRVDLRDVIERVLAKQPGSDRLLLIVDQWEELYTLCRNSEVIHDFVEQLLEATDNAPLTVVSTCRGDFYGRVLEHRPLVDRITENTQIPLGPMNEDELRTVVEAPTREVGLELEAGLTKRILSDVSKEPGRLPLLSFLLHELWQQRRGDLLTNDAYDNIGGVEGAITCRAEHVYAELNEEQQQLLPKVFIQLVSVGEQSEDTRRRAPMGVFGAESQVIIKKLADARLLVTGREETTTSETVEVAHEALIRSWARSQEWVNNARGFLIWRKRLEVFLEVWKKDRAAVLRGGLLAEAQSWLQKRRDDLDRTERKFIEASKLQRGREQRAELEAQRRRVRTWRRFSIAVAGLAVVALILAAWAWHKSVEARLAKEASDDATRQANMARDTATESVRNAWEQLGSAFWQRGVTARDFELHEVRAALLFAESARVYQRSKRPNQTESSLVASHCSSCVNTFVHDNAVIGAIFSADEARVLTWSYDGTARLWDTGQEASVKTFRHDYALWGASFCRDGSRVLTWSEDGTAQLWDIEKGVSLRTFQHGERVNGALLSADEARVLTWSNDDTARLWDTERGVPLRTFHHNAAVVGALFSESASRLLTWDINGEAQLWDSEQGVLLKALPHHSRMDGALFNRDESRVLTWDINGEARLWDSKNGVLLRTFEHSERGVYGALFSRDESRVLTWGGDGTAQLWDTEQEVPLRRFEHSRVCGAMFSESASRLLTWGGDGTARLWETERDVPLRTFRHDSWIRGALLSGDEARVLTWSEDGTAQLWDIAKGVSLRTFRHDRPVYGAVFSRDEARVLTWSDDMRARLWNIEQPAPLRTYKHDEHVNGALFRGDEGHVLTWSEDGTACLWHTEQDVVLQVFEHDDAIRGALLSGDEARVLTWSEDGTAQLWDIEKGVSLRTFQHGDRVNGAVFSRDEARVLTWSGDRTARLWDIERDVPLRTFQHESIVRGAVFSRDESRVLTWDGTAWLWDMEQDVVALKTFQRESWVTGAMFNRDESRVLTWNGDGTAQLWDTEQEVPLKTFQEGHHVHGALFSGDELRVLTWCVTGTVRLWNIEQEVELSIFLHDAPVVGAMFNRDESRVLTWSEDGTARLWNTAQGTLRTFQHKATVLGALFDADESRVLTWSEDGTARLWEVPTIQQSSVESVVVELEVRTGATIDKNGAYRRLGFEEWAVRRTRLAAKRPQNRTTEVSSGLDGD